VPIIKSAGVLHFVSELKHPLFALMRRADEYLAKHDYDRAISDYSEAIKHGALLQEMITQIDYMPKAMVQDLFQDYVPRVFFMRGMAYAGKQLYERAVEDCSEAIKLTNTMGAYHAAEYYRGRGMTYMAMSYYDKAIADYGEVIQLVSKYESLLADALTLRGRAYTAKGDYGLAISDFNRAIELNEKKELSYFSGQAYASIANLFYLRGVSRDQQGEYGSAIADFRQAIAADPGDAYSALRLFLVRAKAEPTAAAKELSVNAARLPRTKWPYPITELMLGLRTADSTLAVASSPTESCEAHFFLGERALLEGDSTVARRFLGSAEAICSKESTMYFVAREEIKRLRP
jgi:tetratricopeptide (TPR) repeat protein